MSQGAGHPLRILIVRIGAMGDILHGMPAVAGLRMALPDCHIGWAVEPRWTPLLVSSAGEMPLVDRVHRVRTREWKRRPLAPGTIQEIAALQQELKAERYDMVVDLQGSIKSAVVGWLAGVPTFIGMDAPRERVARMLYSQRVPLRERSVIKQAGELLSAAVRQPLLPMGARIPADQDAERWSRRLLEGQSGRGPVLLVPQAGWGAKEWGTHNYAALAVQLQTAGFAVLVNKPPGDRLADRVSAGTGVLAVESTLPQMTTLIRNAALVVGGDTGPVHLAAALGTPVVALFGPTEPERNGPYFPRALGVKVLRDPASVTDHRRLTETEAGLKRIRVEEVLAAALELLATPSKEIDG